MRVGFGVGYRDNRTNLDFKKGHMAAMGGGDIGDMAENARRLQRTLSKVILNPKLSW